MNYYFRASMEQMNSMEFELEAIKLNCLHLITMTISKREHHFYKQSDELWSPMCIP